VKKGYVPDRGDIVWLDFTPQSQSGKRPAVVLSPGSYNEKAGLALFCPITSKVKGYPFEVKIEGKIEGVILSDQVRSLDWKTRNAEFIQKANRNLISEVISNLELLIN